MRKFDKVTSVVSRVHKRSKFIFGTITALYVISVIVMVALCTIAFTSLQQRAQTTQEKCAACWTFESGFRRWLLQATVVANLPADAPLSLPSPSLPHDSGKRRPHYGGLAAGARQRAHH